MTSLSGIFRELDQTIHKLSETTSDTRTIKLLVRAMRGEITNAIIAYKTKNPHISFQSVFDFDETNIEKFDIIIDEVSDAYQNYERTELYKTTLHLCAGKNHPLCKKKLKLSDLKNESFVSIGENNGMHKIFLNACKKAGFTPNIVVQGNDVSCNTRCVAAGIGIGFTRKYLGKAKSITNTEVLNVTDLNETQIICSYSRKEKIYGNVEHFLHFIKKEAEKQINHGI